MEPATDSQRPPGRNKRWLGVLLAAAAATAIAVSIFQQDSGLTDAANDVAEDLQGESLSTAQLVKSSSDAASQTGEPASEDPARHASVTEQPEVSGVSAPAPFVSEDSNAVDLDAVLSKKMLGTWEDDYKGHRILTLLADGSGTMVVELDGFAATLFAEKLTFQEKWSVAEGRVTMKATGGEPSGKVGLVLSLHGDTSTQKIVEVTDDRMILVEQPSGTRFEWRRVRNSETQQP